MHDENVIAKNDVLFFIDAVFISWKENKSHRMIGDIVDIFSMNCFSIFIRLKNSINWFDNLPADCIKL